MATMYVRNEKGQFEKVGIGGITTDASLSIVGKPADANAVGNALANCAPLSMFNIKVYYENASEVDTVINSLYSAIPNDQARRVCAVEGGAVWFWDIYRATDRFGCIMAYRYDDSGVTVIRSKNIESGKISPWAYQNPSMEIGTEYLTMEFWNGKPVYAKMFDCGTLPAAKQEEFVNLGVTGTVDSIVDMKLSIKSASNNRQYIYPLHSDDSGLFQTTLYFDGANQRIRLYCLSDQSTKTGILTVKYTKA